MSAARSLASITSATGSSAAARSSHGCRIRYQDRTPRLRLAENILLLRLVHALLPVFLPDLSPRAAVHVRHLVLDRLAGRDRGRLTLDRQDGRDALDVFDRIALVEVAQAFVIAHDADRLHERLGVVEDGLVIERDDVMTLVPDRRVDLDRLHLAGELE